MTRETFNPENVYSSGETTPVRSRAEANLKIRDLYDAGIPFFTKEAIRDVYQQLKKPRKDQKISVKGLDGVFVDFEMQNGHTSPGPDPKEEYS